MARAPTIHQAYYYAVPPNRVYEALTDPKLLARWFVEKAQVTLRKGGAFRLTWHGGYKMNAQVRTADAPNRLSLTWIDRFEDQKVFETHVRFDLRRKGKGTILTVTHRGFKKGKRWTALYGAIESGWAYYLMNLRSVLEHDTDLRSRHDSFT